MTETLKTSYFDLENRTLKFAKSAMKYTKNLPKTVENIEIKKQLFRSAGSVGANYIEANEALGKRDFLMRIKISRKEAKESIYWLELSCPANSQLREKELLMKEATELMNIFGAIFRRSQ